MLPRYSLNHSCCLRANTTKDFTRTQTIFFFSSEETSSCFLRERLFPCILSIVQRRRRRERKKNRSSKILCIMSHTAPSLLPWVFITKTLKFLQISTKKNTKHYKAVSNYFFFCMFFFLFVYLFVVIWEAVTVQLILEAARPGFTAACTQLGGLHPSGRDHRSREHRSVKDIDYSQTYIKNTHLTDKI